MSGFELGVRELIHKNMQVNLISNTTVSTGYKEPSIVHSHILLRIDSSFLFAKNEFLQLFYVRCSHIFSTIQ